jgi:hypothetical protein
MAAAEMITAMGRKILTVMIAAVENCGAVVVEADTDGLIVCTRDVDPQHVVAAVTASIPPIFQVDVEWRDAVCFVSDRKNYMVLDAEGNLMAVKGSKWRGRDKEPYLREAIPEFVRRWVVLGEDAATAYAREIHNEILSGRGWRWVSRTHRVGKSDKFLLQAGFTEGEMATYAYRNKKRGEVARDPQEGYDCDYYAKDFKKTVEDVRAAIRATPTMKRSDNA